MPPPFTTPFGALLGDDHALAGGSRSPAAAVVGGGDQRRVAVDVDVRGVEAVLGGQPPVAADDLALATGLDGQVVVQEAGLQVVRSGGGGSPMKTKTRPLRSSTG